MQTYGKWKIIKKLGAGGQGTVFLAQDTERVNIEALKKTIRNSLLNFSPTSFEEEQLKAGEEIAKSILAYGNADNLANCGALKLLHLSKDDTKYEKQLDRMKSEVKALRSVSHSCIVPVLDEKLEDGWFVMEFYPEGSFSDHLDLFRGDVLSAIVAFRSLVEAVASMHRKGLIHRDIKPDNVFLKGDELVLGDLGLVFFEDQEHSRVTDTVENVGSRDWMPGWAMGVRVEKMRPSFDVFSLGKLFWSMVSGKRVLQLWYHNKPAFNLQTMFPGTLEMHWASKILDTCVVENEEACLSDAGKLLTMVDGLLYALQHHAQVVAEGVDRICRVCGLGRYLMIVNEDLTAANNFGIRAASGSYFKIFTCNYCGHVELFHMPGHGKPSAWRN